MCYRGPLTMMTGSQNSTCCSCLPDIYLFQPDPIYHSVVTTLPATV